VTVHVAPEARDGREQLRTPAEIAQVPLDTATVSARTADRTPANNTSTATGTVVTSADLEVVKRVVTPATGAVTAGTPIEWSVTAPSAR
jgi:hypothetical protein